MTADPEWRFNQARDRLTKVEQVVNGYAAEFNLPVRRTDAPPFATWALAGRPVVRFVRSEHGPDRLEVHEVGLLAPLRRLRLAHVEVESSS